MSKKEESSEQTMEDKICTIAFASIVLGVLTAAVLGYYFKVLGPVPPDDVITLTILVVAVVLMIVWNFVIYGGIFLYYKFVRPVV